MYIIYDNMYIYYVILYGNTYIYIYIHVYKHTLINIKMC